MPRNLTGYLGPTQCSALHCLKVKEKWQKKILNFLGISCGETTKQSKFLTHSPLFQRGLTELMLDIFCCLLYSTSAISATLPYDSETRPEKWEERNAFREERIYTWGHWQCPCPCPSLFGTEPTGSTEPSRHYQDTLWCHTNRSCNLPPLLIVRIVVFLEHLLQLFYLL